jgi:hypothetical protein
MVEYKSVSCHDLSVELTICGGYYSVKKISVLLAMLCVCTAFGGRPALALNVTPSDGAVAIENSFYKAAITVEGGAIRSLILKSTGENMAGRDGMAGDIETSSLNRPNLTADYQLKVVKQSRDEAQVSATLEGFGSCQETGVTYEKTYIFRDDTPLITVRVRIENHSEPKSFAYRVFNTVTPDGRCAGNTYFAEKNTGLESLELPPSKAGSNNFIKDISTGWAGAFNLKNSSALLCKVAPAAVDQYLIFLSEKIATIEWYYKRVSLDTGSVFNTEYFILPLSNVASAAASITAAEKITGGKILSASVKTPEPAQTASNTTGNAVLVAGAFDVLNLSNAYMYRVVQSLASAPKLNVTMCRMGILDNPYKSHFLKGFPSSKSGFAKYRAVVLIDTPAWALDKITQGNLISYVESGGTLIMVGDHARGYKDSKLSGIFPLAFDYSAETKGWARQIYLQAGWIEASLKIKLFLWELQTPPVPWQQSLTLPLDTCRG